VDLPYGPDRIAGQVKGIMSKDPREFAVLKRQAPVKITLDEFYGGKFAAGELKAKGGTIKANDQPALILNRPGRIAGTASQIEVFLAAPHA
jgi:hypothetical protein